MYIVIDDWTGETRVCDKKAEAEEAMQDLIDTGVPVNNIAVYSADLLQFEVAKITIKDGE